MRYLAVIPARGGSKGVPKKNIKILGGKPMIVHTIEAAQQAFSNIDICVSTDSLEIKSVAESTGVIVPFLRPDRLASDTAGTHEVLLHAISYYEGMGIIYDAIVLLQATSPFRNAKHIEEALDLYSDDLDMVVSVTKTKTNPYYVLFEENIDGYLEISKKGKFVRRQDCPDVWEYNGAIYILNVKSLKKAKAADFVKVKKYVMDERTSLDIDTLLDFKLAEYLMERK